MNENRASSRADLFFVLYCELGTGRSLRRLARQLGTAGVRVSLSTLKRFSTRFGWQARVAQFDTDAQAKRLEGSIDRLREMEERQAPLARAMQTAGGEGLRALLRTQQRLDRLRPNEITRLIESGLSQERRIYGTEARDEILVEVWTDFVEQVARLFLSVNDHPDKRSRAEVFADGVDELIDERLGRKRGRGGSRGLA